MKNAIAEDGEVHTPYGATEALPVASITATEVLGQTAQAIAQGAGTCVGKPFDGIEWRVIRITDGPLLTISETEQLTTNEMGELIVRGAVVTDRYVTGTASNQLAKISDGDGLWHRMGDVGYLDAQNRFWFCGRKAHRVLTSDGPMYTVCCEAIFNQHPRVYRSALVGVGPAGRQTPVVIVEPWARRAPKRSERREFVGELAQLAGSHRLTKTIAPQHILIRSSLPVDVRHNAKIFREELAHWAQRKLGRSVNRTS
jgi:acyl-CoA synthetase (AMP-forming)/AMP-acid ligase II